MESFCASNVGHSKFRPALTSSSFYQPASCHRAIRQNDYALSNDYNSRRSALLWQEQPHPGGANKRGRMCSIALAAASFLVLVAVLSIAGLALYMGALHSESPSQVSYSCSAKILRGDRFIGPNQEKMLRYQMQFQTLYQKTILAAALLSLKVERFGEDTYTVFFKITLNKKKVPRNLNVAKTIRDALLNDALSRKPIFRSVRFDPKAIIVKQIEEDNTNNNTVQRRVIKPKEPIKSSEKTKPLLRPNLTLTAQLPIKKKHTENTQKPNPVAQGSFIISKTEADITEKKNTTFTTTQKPKSTEKAKANETSVTSALYKIAVETTSPKEASTIPPTKPTTAIPTFFDAEPWIPIYPKVSVNTSEDVKTTTPSPIKLLNNRQPVYTSFTNPGLSFHSADAETLGATKIKSHPIPVDKITDITEASVWHTPKNPYVEVETVKYIPSKNVTKENLDIKLKQQQVLRNISSIFHSLASSLGVPIKNFSIPTFVTATTSVMKDNSTEESAMKSQESTTTERTTTERTTKKSVATTTTSKPQEEPILGTGQVEVVEVDEALMLQTTKLPLVTLLPVKSNSGIRRPLRPRPNETDKEMIENRSFPSDSTINKIGSQKELQVSNKTNFKIMGVLNFVTEISEHSTSASISDIIRRPKMEPKDSYDEIKIIAMNSSYSKMQNYTLSPEKIRQLSEISKINDNETIISDKSIRPSYTLNHAGFKVLTKTLNKIPGGSYKSDINNFTTECNNFTTIKCGDGKCLPDTTRCNQLVDCNDGEDEKNCNCADYLKSQFLLRKICDGVVDCWDFSDENQCEWCVAGQYVCGNSKVCIDRNKICDGVKDCPQGDDERQCFTLAPTLKEAEEFPYHSEGFLMVRKNGQWGKLCVENFDNGLTSKTWNVTDVGKSVCKAMTYQDLDHVERFQENKTQANYYELNDSLNITKSMSFKKTNCDDGDVVKIKCKHLECGSRPQATEHSARIVGGSNAGLGSWPWQAALYKEGDFQCGATLLSDRWLLSAGHCFFHSLEEHWVARLGALRRGSALPSPYEQLRPIVQIVIHPDYVDVGFINDISLLQMEYPVIFSDYVRPICLPQAEVPPKDGRMCTVVGWGQLFEVGRIFPDTLQEVQVPVISTLECRKRTIFLPLYSVTDNMFCAGFERGGRDACLGDSGGPLMCPEPDGRWVLHGVTSNGYGCARSDRPGVYTKVANYIPWIDSYMSNEKNITVTKKNICSGHRCPLGECLPKSRLCNGFIECTDGSDEKDCT